MRAGTARRLAIRHRARYRPGRRNQGGFRPQQWPLHNSQRSSKAVNCCPRGERRLVQFASQPGWRMARRPAHRLLRDVKLQVQSDLFAENPKTVALAEVWNASKYPATLDGSQAAALRLKVSQSQ